MKWDISFIFFHVDTWFSQHCLKKYPSLLYWSDIPICQITGVHKCVDLFWESLFGFIQWCADKCLATSSSLSSPDSKKPWFVAFAAFWWGVNTPTMTSFKLPTWCHRMQSSEEMPTVGSQEQSLFQCYIKKVSGPILLLISMSPPGLVNTNINTSIFRNIVTGKIRHNYELVPST